MRKGLIAAAAVTALLIAAVGGAANASASPKVPVSQGLSTLLLQQHGNHGGQPPVTAFGNTDPNTPEEVSFILDIQNENQLEALVSNGLSGHYLSTPQFAQQYGQSPQNIAALQSYLTHYGITTSVMADNLDVQASGTAGEFNNALSVTQRDYQTAPVPAHSGHPAQPAHRFHGSATNPELPRQLGSFVEAILGLSTYPTFSSDAVRAPQDTANNASTEQLGNRTPQNFMHDYNVPRGTGRGSTIGVVTLAALDQPSAEYFWSNIVNANRTGNLTVDNVDGGPGAVSDAAGSGETTLDVEQSGTIAPGANIVVYQAPNTDPGFLDAFFQAASDNQADTVSASWGEAESVINWAIKTGQESPGYQGAFDEAFLELAAQGQSTFVSSGDAGAYDDSDELGSTNLDIDSPGNSPWVTSSGGTTQAGQIPFPIIDNDPTSPTYGQQTGTDVITIPQERAWGWDYLWPHYQDLCFLFTADGINAPCTEQNWAEVFGIGGDGGGYSGLEPMPSYQRQVGAQHYSAVQYLTPIDYDSTDFEWAPLNLPSDWSFNFTPSVQTGIGNGRGEPDLSADADPETGYQEYFSFDNCATNGVNPDGTPASGPPCIEYGWGGTSFVAPQFNGTTAVIDANLGHRVGLWNPQIYSFAQSHNSPFKVLSSASANNDNLFYTGTPHQVWNPATGLGIPNLTTLQGDFARNGH